MGMKELFQQAAMTAFKAIGNVVESATYIEVQDDGFGNISTVESDCQIIYDTFSDKLNAQYSFASKIQIKDKKGLVPSLSISTAIRTRNTIRSAAGINYTIVAKEMDAANAMYILLLRKV